MAPASALASVSLPTELAPVLVDRGAARALAQHELHRRQLVPRRRRPARCRACAMSKCVELPLASVRARDRSSSPGSSTAATHSTADALRRNLARGVARGWWRRLFSRSGRARRTARSVAASLCRGLLPAGGGRPSGSDSSSSGSSGSRAMSAISPVGSEKKDIKRSASKQNRRRGASRFRGQDRWGPLHATRAAHDALEQRIQLAARNTFDRTVTTDGQEEQ